MWKFCSVSENSEKKTEEGLQRERLQKVHSEEERTKERK